MAPAVIVTYRNVRCDGGKSVKTKKAESKTDPKLSLNILRIVPANNAFYFFTDVGQYC